MDNGEKVGFIQIRHAPSRSTELPASLASHIYYEVEPPHLKKGYGFDILRLGLGEAKNIGLREIILTCDAENVASKKIIERNGGVFLEEALIPSTKRKMLKYCIKF